MATPNNVMMDNVLDSIKSTLQEANLMGFDSYAEQTIAFFKAIDWTQPWLLALISFHVLCFLIAIGLRNRHNQLSVYFFVLLGFALLTQPLNSLGMKHWKSFCTEKYFDASGIFIVSVYAFPLIFNGFVTLMLILKATLSVMIDTKRAQLNQKIKASKKKSKQN
ncbi:unnamed protein product [Mucor hiemalis]